MNAINIIHPYQYEGQWVFDDKSKDLDKEPFVAGADTLLDTILDTFKYSKNKMSIVFSANDFPGSRFSVEKVTEYGPDGGTDYFAQEFNHKLWLCPALLKYFNSPPESIHFQIT